MRLGVSPTIVLPTMVATTIRARLCWLGHCIHDMFMLPMAFMRSATLAYRNFRRGHIICLDEAACL